jgi:hypothetical protein
MSYWIMIFHSKSQAQDMLSSGVPIHDARVFELWIVKEALKRRSRILIRAKQSIIMWPW